jgi:propanol-preferring alcohol dehydrogenase
LNHVQAWTVVDPGPIGSHPLHHAELPVPEAGPGELLVRVLVCGVCRTDLHVAEGDLDPHRSPVVPGHEIVGVVDSVGPGATRFGPGDRVGVAWLRHTCGVCRWCTSGRENLCTKPQFTGWDADGGYAEYAVVDESYAYSIPALFEPEQAAPLLCAGIIGYRALKRAALPEGGRLGIYGFGGSAHLTAQIALHQGARVHVMTRSRQAQELALELGRASAAGADAPPPEPLDAAILFAPVGELVPVALRALDRGGTLAFAGIHLSDIPPIEYLWLFQERQIRSVTANTRADGEELLALAAQIPIRATTTPYALADANQALADLANDRVEGAAVLHVASGTG